MRPRTKFQKKILDIFHNSECPENVKEWAADHFMNQTVGFPLGTRHKFCYCSKCGNKIKISDETSTQECKDCGSKVIIKESMMNRRVLRGKHVFAVFRVIEDIQFVFFYKMSYVLRKKHARELEFKSYGAIALNGNAWVAIRRPFYYKVEDPCFSKADKCRHPEYRVYTYSKIYYFTCKGIMVTCPIMEFLPRFKYIGLNTEIIEVLGNGSFPTFCYRLPDFSNFRCIEIAVKKGDMEFLRTVASKEEFNECHNRAYIIANRHHYTASDWGLWWDMVSLLGKSGKDIHNPKYVCPDDLSQAHAQILDFYERKCVRDERKKKLEYFKNGPFDINWHLRFYPDRFCPNFICDLGKILQTVKDCGYAEDEYTRAFRERNNIPERPVVVLEPFDTVNTCLYEYYYAVRAHELSELYTDEKGNLSYRLREEFDGFPLELSPDNVVLNPECLFQAGYDFYNGMPEPTQPDKETTFKQLKSRFIGLVFQDEELSLMTLDSPAEYCKEAANMHNCIASLDYYLKKHTLVMSARIDDKSVADVEISLDNFSILQCYGPCNHVTPYKDRIQALVETNKDKIKERMSSNYDYRGD